MKREKGERAMEKERTFVQLPPVRAALLLRCALAGAGAASWAAMALLVPMAALGAQRLSGSLTVGIALGCGMALALAAGGALAALLRGLRRDCDQTSVLALGCFLWAVGAAMNGFDGAMWLLPAGCALLGAGATLCALAAKSIVGQLASIATLCDMPAEESVADARRDARPRMLLAAAGALLLSSVLLLILRPRFRLGLMLAQMVCLLALAGCIRLQPFDRHTARLLRHYGQTLSLNVKNLLTDKMIDHAYHRPWLLQLLAVVLRVFFWHRLENVENIHMDEDNPLIFLANHGELYGPLACYLHIPVYLRPWSISNIMVDKKETCAYIYKYDFENAAWLPKCLRMPAARLVTELAHWLTHSMESVPVFRDHPRKLMNTFRLASDVLESGDAMLIFPENPNAVAQDHGYEREGVGELFTGFAMLAPIYYNRAQKRCRFLPVFASQKTRTLRFGTEVVYDPDNAPIEERDRMVNEIAEQLQRMYHELEG